MNKFSPLYAAAASMCMCAAAVGQSATPAPDGPVVPPNDSKLQFAVTPFFWAPGINGNMTVRGAKIDMDVSFTDIAQDASQLYGFMGALDMTYDRFVMQFNGSYAHVGMDGSRGRAGADSSVSLSADAKTDMTWLELMGGYRFVDTPIGADGSGRRLTLDGFVGARYTNLEAHANVTASADVTLPDGTPLSANVQKGIGRDEDWVDPFVGVRSSIDLSEHWSLQLRGDVGGFGISSDFAWQGVAGFGYRFKMGSVDSMAFIGYRAIGDDYSHGEFAWDAITHGPVIGLQMRF